MNKSGVMSQIDRLKGELINELSQMDLVGKIVQVRDNVSNFTGGAFDETVSGMSTFATITDQEGDIIFLNDDFDDELGEYSLESFGLEFLIQMLD